MSIKLVALGNVLMKDDAIGLAVAEVLQDRLMDMGIQVIYGETDFLYCLSMIAEDDYIFLIDAAATGKYPGKITNFTLNIDNRCNTFDSSKFINDQHNVHFLDLLNIYYPKIQGQIFAIEVKEVMLEKGLSIVLEQKLHDIAEEIICKLENYLLLQESNLAFVRKEIENE